MGLGRGDASGNGTWICDIVGYKLSIEIQPQRTGIKIKIREDVWEMQRGHTGKSIVTTNDPRGFRVT